MAKKAPTPRRICFDIEADGLLHPEQGKKVITRIHCIGVIVDGDDPIYFADPDVDAENGLGEAAGDFDDCLALLDTADVLYGHNINGYDLPVLKRFFEWEPNKKTLVRDTLVLARMLWPDTAKFDFPLFAKKCRTPESKKFWKQKIRGRHSLQAWGWRLGEGKIDFGEEAEEWESLSPEMVIYCKQDCVVTRALYGRCFQAAYSNQALELEHKFHHACERQMRKGVYIDPVRFEKLEQDLVGETERRREELQALVPPKREEMKTPQYYEDFDTGERFEKKKDCTDAVQKRRLVAGPLRVKETLFNPNSRPQVAEYLQRELGWKPTEYTEAGTPKMDADSMELAAEFHPEIRPFAEFLILNHRAGQMFKGERSVAHCIQADGRVHGYINHNGANTSRCTHAYPNNANIPSCGKPYGADCRGSFSVPPGYKMVGGDAKGLELCALGHYLAPFDNGKYLSLVIDPDSDIHTHNQIAAGLPTRDKAKTFIYALIYGAGDALLGAIVGGGEKEGARLRAKFFRAIPSLSRLDRKVREKAGKQKYLRGLDGRVLWVRSKHSALNLLLQSFGAIAMKQATVNLHEQCDALGWDMDDAAMVLHVHDEMQWEVRESLVPTFEEQMTDAFGRVQKQLGMRCPLDVDVKIGTTWAETH